jgi:ataxin-3
MVKPQPAVYHERQQSAMCGQHALNNLLQGAYLTSANLHDFAHDLSQRAKNEGFDEPASNHYSDSGNYSVMVMTEALRHFNLELKQFNETASIDRLVKSIGAQGGIIVNNGAHWATFRKLDGIWYNLDSLLREPSEITEPQLIESLEGVRSVNAHRTLFRISAGQTPFFWG